jgi:hypothetical protein
MITCFLVVLWLHGGEDLIIPRSNLFHVLVRSLWVASDKIWKNRVLPDSPNLVIGRARGQLGSRGD